MVLGRVLAYFYIYKIFQVIEQLPIVGIRLK